MEKLPRQKYTKEFREQAVRLVREQELPIPKAARRLSMSDKTRSNGVLKARHGELVRLNGHRKPVTDLEAEVSRLTRELAEARMKRDLLKKPPRTLPRRSGPVRAHDDAAPSRSPDGAVSRACGLQERLPRLDKTPPLEVHPGERAVGSRDPGRPCAHTADLRARTAP